MFKRFFALESHGATLSGEILAGLTTFAAMAYILAVNPAILASTGMDQGALITATALTSAVMTVVMALATNYPIALAPGMGLNAFFAYTLCGVNAVPWQAALGVVFYSGLLFFALSVTGLRRKVVDAFPHGLKLAITAGIGFFIAFIGLKNGGVIVSNPATFVALGDLSRAGPMLTVAGILLMAVLVGRKIPGALILGVAVLTVAGLFLPNGEGTGMITARPERFVHWPASLAPTFLKLDLAYFWQHFFTLLPLLVALLFMDIFDNMGTLIGVSQCAGLLDKEGNLPRMGRAFMADAGAAMFGSLLGTSTVTSYIESAVGVEAGGRTGLTVVTTAVCFLLALFLTPLIAIVPAAATAPALVIVGVLMLRGLSELDFGDFSVALPSLVTILIMPLTFSISDGIAFGLICHVVLKVGMGQYREVGWIGYALCLLFGLHFFYGR